MKKIILFFLVLFSVSSKAQEFDLRINVQSCNTFTVQIRCTDGTYLPNTSDIIDVMDFSIISTGTFALNAGSSSNGFNIGSTATTTDNGYNVRSFSEQSYGNITTNFVLNTWYDVCSFTITSGTTNLLIGTSAELPTIDGAYFGTSSYFLYNELGRETTQGTLAKNWLGTTSSDWGTASNWCPSGAPATGENVVIINQTNDPVMSSSASLTTLELQSGSTLSLSGNNLTLNGSLSGTGVIIGSNTSSLTFSGAVGSSNTLNMDNTTNGTTNVLSNLTVNRNGGLTIGDSLRIIGVLTPTLGTITTNNKLILASTGVGTYGQIAGSGSGTFTGNVKVEKTLSATNTGWRQIAFPVTGTVADIRGMAVRSTSHSTAGERNIFYWDATDAGANVATGWTGAAATDNQSRAYSIYGNNTNGGLHDISSLIWMSGVPNSGNFNFAIKNTTDPNSVGAGDDGWNLIPNPYPSNLDITSLFASSFGGVNYKAIHVWNKTANQYQAIVNGVSVIVYNGTNGTANTSTVIPPFQGFWVKADANVTFSMTNANRTTSMTGTGTFMKNGFDLARINVFDKDSAADQMVIYFQPNAKAGFDPALDGYKLLSLEAAVPSIYAVNSDGKFSINALPEQETDHSVPVGFRSNKTGQKNSISLNKDELDSKWFVYLEDKQLDILYDLKNSDYVFTHTANSDSRFVIHFQQHPTSSNKLVADVQKLNAGGDGEFVYVFVPNYFREQAYEIEIFDLTGKRVYHTDKAQLNHGINTLNLNIHIPGYYVVRVISKEDTVSNKVYIK